MKRSPQLQFVVDRMGPGGVCREGFLGSDPRPLEEILDADNSTVAGMNRTHAQIAERLQTVMDVAIAAQGRGVSVGPHLEAGWHEAMGRIPSPWPGEGTFSKGEMELTDARTGRTVRVTPLAVHLIAAHGFYQGRGSRYRLEPDELAAMLGL
ncbi:MAG: hypothetical protein PHU85_16430 [Phycisphaerae bacterium]|nr:hypothetical protein [Phycisphaerae bacterium]